MGQKPGKAMAGGAGAAASATPSSYVLLVKSEACGWCKDIQQKIAQLMAENALRVPYATMDAADVGQNPKYAALVRQAYLLDNPRSRGVGGVPLMMRIRNGKLMGKSDVRLGSGPKEQVKVFMNGL
jgi:hypothetical protein